MVTLGNLLQSYSKELRMGIGFLAGILLVLLIAKIFLYWNGFKESLDNPVLAGTFATFPMAITIISTYLPKNIGIIVWFTGIIIQIIVILIFTQKFVLKFDIKKVFTTWYIVYVGIVTASVTSPLYKMQSLGKMAFWFGFISYFILVFIVCYRVFVVKNIPEPAQPTLVVLAAPASLLLAGYVNAFKDKNMTILYVLLFCSVLFYVYSLLLMPKLLKLPFYPSYAAFTFPLVVSALAMKLTVGFLKKSGQDVRMLANVVKLEELIATLIVVYVLARFLMFIFQDEKK